MKYAINDNGTLKVFNEIPKVWKGKTGVRRLSRLEKMVLGFFPISYPQLEEYKKYGDLTIDDHWGNKYIMPIISMTADDIVRYDEKVLDIDESALAEDMLESDGVNEYRLLRNKIKRAETNEVITPTEFKQLRRFVKPILAQLKLGDWDLVLEDLNKLLEDNPNIPNKMKNIINQIIARVEIYVADRFE